MLIIVSFWPQKLEFENTLMSMLINIRPFSIVRPGQKLKIGRSKAKMPSMKNKCSRDWGGGMATTGRSKTCTKVPPNHFGPIPGVEVGMCWKYRIQISEEGLHR